MRARRLPLTGVPGRQRDLLASNSAPDVAVTPKGISFVVWTTPAGKVLLRRIAADGRIGPAREIASSGQLAQVAVSPSGHAIVAWVQFTGMSFVALARRVAPNGTPGGTTFTLGPAFFNTPAVVLAPDRTATVLWLGSDGTNQRAQSRRIARSGSLGPVRNLSARGWERLRGQARRFDERNGDRGLGPKRRRRLVRADAPDQRQGNASARADALRPGAERLSVRPRCCAERGLDLPLEPLGRLGAEGPVAPHRGERRGRPDPKSLGGGSAGSDLTISAGSTGVVFMAWRRLNGGLFDVAQALRLSPTGQPGKVKNVSAAGRNTNDLDIAVSRAGSATLVWYSNDGSKDVVQAARFRP